MSTYTDIVAKIQSLLPELTNSSESSIWKRIAQAVSSAIDTAKLNCSNSEIVITNVARTQRVAGRQYYIDKSLAFQYGDSLSLINADTYQYGYAVIDPSKQIIKQCAVKYENQIIAIYVAKSDANGLIVPLSNDELYDFTSYLESLSPIGVSTRTYSNYAWVVGANSLIIRYDSNFSLVKIKSDLQTAMTNIQLTLRGFKPVFVNEITDIFKSVEGVVDAYMINPFTKPSDASTSTTVSTDGQLSVGSGYFNFTSDFRTLNASVVQFIAQ